MEDTKYRYISWSDVHYYIDVLAEKISNSETQFVTCWGIPRGGLVPATMLSHRLKLDYSVDINEDYPLIVDEICDSGKTLKGYDSWQTATLIYKPHTSIFKPTFYAEEYTGDDWIVFPWE